MVEGRNGGMRQTQGGSPDEPKGIQCRRDIEGVHFRVRMIVYLYFCIFVVSLDANDAGARAQISWRSEISRPATTSTSNTHHANSHQPINLSHTLFSV